jgi:hypothetical protein
MEEERRAAALGYRRIDDEAERTYTQRSRRSGERRGRVSTMNDAVVSIAEVECLRFVKLDI